MAKKFALIDKTLCVACGCCMKICPKNAITIYRGIYAQVDENKCIGCGLCSKECPASIITIESLEVGI